MGLPKEFVRIWVQVGTRFYTCDPDRFEVKVDKLIDGKPYLHIEMEGPGNRETVEWVYGVMKELTKGEE